MKEIELKFVTTPELIKTHLASLSQVLDIQHWGKKTLVNQYFDTSDQALNQHRIALRIRQVDGRFIQTLKTKGHSVAGLHQRGEWEWDVPEDRLHLEYLNADVWPADISVNDLRPVFETNFERSMALIRQHDSEIELAIDQGEIVAGDQRKALCEIELELKSGDPKDLFELADRIARMVPVVLSDVSKAEQGYRVAGLSTPVIHKASGRAPASDIDAFVQHLVQVNTSQWLSCLDVFVETGDVSVLRQAIHCLASIQQVSVVAGLSLVSEPLDVEIERLYGLAARQAHKKLDKEARLQGLLASNVPGVLGVGLGRYLTGAIRS